MSQLIRATGSTVLNAVDILNGSYNNSKDWIHDLTMTYQADQTSGVLKKVTVSAIRDTIDFRGIGIRSNTIAAGSHGATVKSVENALGSLGTFFTSQDLVYDLQTLTVGSPTTGSNLQSQVCAIVYRV